MTRTSLATALLMGTALVSLAQVAKADDGFQAGDILARARVVGVIPITGSTNPEPLNGGTDLGGAIVTHPNAIPEVDLTYFFTENLGVEAIAGMDRLEVTNGDFKNTVGSPIKLGSTWILPPTITVDWHFLPKYWINPYVGAGLNYTFFMDTHGTSQVTNTPGTFMLSNSLGYALHFGADVNIAGNWYANLDAKKIFLTTDAVWHNGTGALVTSKVDLDPWLLGLGVGYKF